jgi:peptidyl-prolyl cis-trans isomerase C
MTFFRSVLLVFPAACLLAQTPPAQPRAVQATPVPKPSVNVSTMPMTAPAALPNVPPDKVIITVGDLKITAGQFEQIISTLPAQYQNSARGAGRKQFAENLTRILLLSEEGKHRKLDESPTYQTQIRFQNANILAGMTYDALGKDAKFTDAEVRKYYDEHLKDFEQIRARHILIRMRGSPLPVKPGQKDLTEAEALAKTQELEAKLKAGASFEDLARAESDDSGSGANGGDLGFFHHNQMVPPFDEAAFKLKVGEVSQPVKSQFGYHIIRLEAIKTFEDVRPDVEKKMRPEMAQKALTDMEKKAGVQYDPEFFPPAPAPAATPSAPAAAK